MSEALAVVNMPSMRPKGVTPRQWRLAAIYPRAESAYQAMRLAGYAHSTATQNAKSQLDTLGVKRARAAIEESQLDSARGFAGASRLALKTAKEDIAALEPRDRIAAAVKFAEVANTLGEHVQDRGDGDRHKYRQHRTARIAYYMGILAGRSPQHMVLSPAEIMERLKK